LATGGVLENNIALSSVTTDKIADGAVTLDKIANQAWTSFTPTWTNLTIGNGTQTFRYVRIGNTVVVQGRLVFGSTTSISGNVSFAAPVAADMLSNVVVGTANLIDGGTDERFGPVIFLTGVGLSLRVYTAGGTYAQNVQLSSTVPFTWANTDVIALSAVYEAD